jgi:hypothetical protein
MFHAAFCDAFWGSSVAAYVHSAIATVDFGHENLGRYLGEDAVTI